MTLQWQRREKNDVCHVFNHEPHELTRTKKSIAGARGARRNSNHEPHEQKKHRTGARGNPNHEPHEPSRTEEEWISPEKVDSKLSP